MLKNVFRLLFTSVLLALVVIFADLLIENKIDLLWSAGLVKDVVPIAGTGSMYPTYPKGVGTDVKALGREIVSEARMYRFPRTIKMFGHKVYEYKPQYLDIVAFSNAKTSEISKEIYNDSSGGYIKRIIGLPGDKIELRDGIVYRNSLPLKEPYTALPHSTFGGTSLNECTVLVIPQDKVFVLGDNRKGSLDSRFDLGLINITDIDHYLPYAMQPLTLRDTTNDLRDSSRIQLNTSELLSNINKIRQDHKLKKLNNNDKLNQSASKRGEIILKYDDFSFSAVKSNYDMKKAMNDVGYDNVVWGEIPLQGYYTAEEITSNISEFSDSLNFLLNPDFDDFGVAVVQGEINNCPTQVINIQFAGYKPAIYDKGVIDSWQRALTNLKDVRVSWDSLTSNTAFYRLNKEKIDRIIEILNIRSEYITRILNKMKNSEWLTASEEQYMNNDSKLVDEFTSIAEELNKAINTNK